MRAGPCTASGAILLACLLLALLCSSHAQFSPETQAVLQLVSKLGAGSNPFKLPNFVMPNLNADGNTNTTTKADKSKTSEEQPML